MKRIPLTKGHFALVDDEDFSFLTQFKWFVVGRGKNLRAGSTLDGQRIYMHRHLLKATRGLEVDHIDGDSLNNRRSNLRLCTHKENLRNQRKQAKTSSKYKGVYWNRQRGLWQAQITVDDQRISLGRFATEKAAAQAYDLAAKEHFGVFAKLNRAA